MISKDSVIIVLSHANNEWRKHLLKECLNSLSGDVILSTNYPVDFETQKMCDWVVYSKKNEILTKEEYSKYNVFFNYWYYNTENEYTEIPLDFDHGYAAYTLIKQGVKFAEMLGKTKIHIINYDYRLTGDVFKENDIKLDTYDLVCYRYENTDYHEPSYCTGVISSNINPLFKFSNHYNDISEYYNNKETDNIILEVRFDKIINSYNYNILEENFNELRGDLDFENVFSTQNNTNRFKEIGLKYGCDKVSRHRYHEIYPDVFEKYQNKEINLFEIGIDEGKSLKVWKEYYPNCNVFGMDIQNEIANEDVTIFKGDQSNLEDLNNIISKIPKCDVIIDDGSHVAEHQLKTFYHLFEHLLNDGGTYIIEDIECSYWKPSNTIYNYETGHLNIIDYFTKLNHQVNSNYNSTDNHLRIKQITFFPNCIILKKEVL
jgi:hypothetical protein